MAAKLGKKRRGSLERREWLWGYLFIAPWLIGLLVFVAGPMLFSLYASFTNYDITSQFDWIGIRNYVRLLTDDQFFWLSVKNTLYYTVFAVPLGIAVGVVAAVLLNLQIPGQRLFRTIFYIPKLLTGVSLLMLWMWVFNPQVGLINTALTMLGVDNPPLWLSDAAWSKPAMIIMSGWSSIGGMLIYLAGLQAIPNHLYEASDIDGASKLRQFLSITVPLLTPTIFFKLITGISGALQTWTNSLIMTQGGPSNSTLFYGLYLYKKAFTEMRMGYASAMAWMLLVVAVVIAAIQFWGSQRWVYYEGERR